MTSLDGKVAVITGASRGIGAACATALDQAGAQVVLTGRSIDDLEAVASTLSNKSWIVPRDLLERTAGRELADEVLSLTGRVDVLVNNAGIPMRRAPHELTEDDIDRVFAVNVRSLLMLSVKVGQSMAERGGGSIVNISSIAGHVGFDNRVAYAGTKGAVEAITRTLAADWGSRRVRVNSVAPGMIATPIWDDALVSTPDLLNELAAYAAVGRCGTAEDIADVVTFLASDASRYITGETITVDGGLVRTSMAFRPKSSPRPS